MAPSPSSSSTIDPAKVEGLRQALARGPVTFKNGSEVRRDPEWPRDVLVSCQDGKTRRVNDWAHDQLGQAYGWAIAERESIPRPPAPSKPTRSRTDFGDDPPF